MRSRTSQYNTLNGPHSQSCQAAAPLSSPATCATAAAAAQYTPPAEMKVLKDMNAFEMFKFLFSGKNNEPVVCCVLWV